MYKGAKWLGIDLIRTADGKEIKPGEIIENMPEDEARVRKGFEPVNEGSSSKKKIKKEVNEDAEG